MMLDIAVRLQGGLPVEDCPVSGGLPRAFHVNQREEIIDLGDTAGALMATRNMQMQTFITESPPAFAAGFSVGAGASAGSVGYQEEIAPTLKGTPSGSMMPSVLCLNDQRDGRMDCTASTESARQYKDATDLVLKTNAPACRLIRRLMPVECERLQGFPDGWTDLPGASDSARYKALGNSVAVPCVEYLMRGIAEAVRAGL